MQSVSYYIFEKGCLFAVSVLGWKETAFFSVSYVCVYQQQFRQRFLNAQKYPKRNSSIAWRQWQRDINKGKGNSPFVFPLHCTYVHNLATMTVCFSSANLKWNQTYYIEELQSRREKNTSEHIAVVGECHYNEINEKERNPWIKTPQILDQCRVFWKSSSCFYP